MLSDSRIRELILMGKIGLSREGESWTIIADLLQPASIEVTLSPEFLSPGLEPNTWNKVAASSGTPALLLPGRFALASTAETIRVPDFLVSRIEGKSSLARKGLVVHSTAGFIDPGFTGTLTLELSNVGPWPIQLDPGMKIAQLSFDYVDGVVEFPYGSEILGSHYQDQRGPTPAAT